jgi:hypothetical protein
VTSFLDEETPAEVLRVLARAKELNRRLRLSFDPGFDWADHPSAAVEGILALTDLLFVNYREFKALGRYEYGEPDDAIARKVLRRCGAGCTVFITKRYDFVQVYRRPGADLLAYRFQVTRPARETELEDATGAGDVFAAAVLGSLTSRRMQVELGAFLGLSLARHKMRRRLGHMDLPDLSTGFLQQSEPDGRLTAGQPGVVLAHDGDPQAVAVREFSEQHCGLRTYELNSASADEPELNAVLRESLDRCNFAICLLTTRDTTTTRADQKLVYQAGVLQGRYGFGRVALLVEEGCDTFSNVAGLIRLDFPHGRVNSTFVELERMLERENLVRRGSAAP